MQRTRRGSSPLAALIALAALLGGVLACATKIPLLPSSASASPSATGNVHAKLDANGNAWVELDLEQLAPSPRATYVIWAESQFGRQVLLGRIAVAKDGTAEWAGTVPFDKFRMILTAEDTAWPERPSAPYVVQTDFVEAGRGWF
ncbi:MAG TPA: hypothetical protein VKH41_14190 [Myxococcota bacterium]|nr:hypothetical protein [Myxococcota bacterium]